MVEKLTSSTILSKEQLNRNFKVFAGPGAGKTHFLVENIKNIISSDELITKSRSRKLACITYTNAAVDELKHRLEFFSEYVDIYTIHGFIIENIIKPFQETLIAVIQQDYGFERSSSGLISSQVEGVGILHGIEKGTIFEYIKSFDGGKYREAEVEYSKKAMGDVQVDINAFVIATLNGTPYQPSISRPKNIKAGHEIPIKQYLWDVVRKLTHNEVLYFGLRILQISPAALYALRVKFPFIFVDEFQDTSPLQTLIIKLIGEKSTRIGIVGDVAQSIYSFQGAKPSDFLQFAICDGQDGQYSIDNNRRSTRNIVNFCNFIRQSDMTIQQISVKEYSNEEDGRQAESKPVHFLLGESQNVKATVAGLLSSGGVVLTRTWAAAFNYIQNINESQAKLLTKIYYSYSNSPIQIRDEIIEYNNVTWVRAFRFIFNLYTSYSLSSFVDMIKAIEVYSNINTHLLTPQVIFSINKVAKLVFAPMTSEAKTVDILKRFNSIISREEFLQVRQLLSSTASFEIPIFEELDRQTLVDAVSSLEWETSFRLFNEVFSENSKYMTVHQAKGLEWETVIVSVFPSKQDHNTLSHLFSSPSIMEESASDEFVRLFYVACSRAERDLYVHLASECTRQEIETALSSFTAQTHLDIQYEFIE